MNQVMHQQAKVQMQNKVPSKFRIVYYTWLAPWTVGTLVQSTLCLGLRTC
jgi:hypothetical protein